MVCTSNASAWRCCTGAEERTGDCPATYIDQVSSNGAGVAAIGLHHRGVIQLMRSGCRAGVLPHCTSQHAARTCNRVLQVQGVVEVSVQGRPRSIAFQPGNQALGAHSSGSPGLCVLQRQPDCPGPVLAKLCRHTPSTYPECGGLVVVRRADSGAILAAILGHPGELAVVLITEDVVGVVGDQRGCRGRGRRQPGQAAFIPGRLLNKSVCLSLTQDSTDVGCLLHRKAFHSHSGHATSCCRI
jgi:hypothetical protein